MSRLPEPECAAIAAASWPATHVAHALSALAVRAGLPTLGGDQSAAAVSDLTADQAGPFIDAAAARAGLQADQVFAGLHELNALVADGAPALLRITAVDGSRFIAVLGAKNGRVTAIGPDLRVHRLSASAIGATVRAPFEATVEAEVDRVLGRMDLRGRSFDRARSKMIDDRLRSVRFRGCWLLRLPSGAPVADAAREAALPRRLAILVATHLGHYAVFVLSWWLLGRAVLAGTVDRGWLWGWGLLLLSMVPLRLAATWSQGLATVSIGAWLRRRLLRGAFAIDRHEIGRKGVGQLFGIVIEAAAVDALALTGGISAAFAGVELAVALMVLSAGAAPFQAPMLGGWAALSGYFAWVYLRRRQSWTAERLHLTHDLLESMVGHRTRLVQQREATRHDQEDEALDRYITLAHSMDASGLWLTAFIPRGWLVLALASLTPALSSHASSAQLAVSVGGALLAYRALQRLAAGVSSLIGAAIAGHSVAGLVGAAARPDAPCLPSVVTPAPTSSDPEKDSVAVLARDLTFRYRSGSEPVLRGCTLTIERNARFLLEGRSGSGKTTFGSILAGLDHPESGLVLAGGLDRASLGAAGWRARVLMAPQAHENYLVAGSLAFNLLMGRQWPPERPALVEAEAVCRELGLGDLIDRLPGGLHQIVGETGWQLSQGERTRVFLARALLQRPDVLILDESFGALDSDNVDRAARCVAGRAAAVLAIAHL